jgi:hypothetical protein
MEPKGIYRVSVNNTESINPTCACGFVLGERGEAQGKAVLIVGELKLFALHGFCPKCGARVHWTESDDTFKRLMKRASKNA